MHEHGCVALRVGVHATSQSARLNSRGIGRLQMRALEWLGEVLGYSTRPFVPFSSYICVIVTPPPHTGSKEEAKEPEDEGIGL